MTKFNFSLCGAVWQKEGKTNCWSADHAGPAHCPSREHMDTINESIELYKGDSEDAQISQRRLCSQCI
jgi:hypothetical protein